MSEPLDLDAIRAQWERLAVGDYITPDAWQVLDALEEARGWARHGYEIGQRSCTWSDQGVAPKWLTEGHTPEALEASTEMLEAEAAQYAVQAVRSLISAAVARGSDTVEVRHLRAALDPNRADQ